MGRGGGGKRKEMGGDMWGGGEVEGGWGAAVIGSNLTNGVGGHFVSVTFGYLLRDSDGGQVSDLTRHGLV